MRSTGQSIERIEALRALVARLGSPDLTLVEAKDLRHRVLALTGVDREESAALGVAPPAATPAFPCQGRQQRSRSSGCHCCAA